MEEKSELIENYRKAFVTIKTFPFIYTALLLVVSPFEAWLSLKWAELLGLFFFTSVPSVWLCWRLSKAIKLCPWHRAQCFIMLLPLAIPLCRIFMPDCVISVWIGVAILLMASLVNAYFVFIKPSVKNKNSRNNV
ncbi:MAG: hypothetical protein HDS71_07475 [Bacteroidales bacterium]|nr:hypothetical protein [Bacteroidales bacterium]